MTLVRLAVEGQGRTLVLVRAPLDERDLARAQEAAVEPRDTCVVVDDPAGHVGPGEAAELAIALGHPGLVVLGHTPRPEWDASQTSTVLRPVDLLADPPSPREYLHAGLSCHLADDHVGAGRLYRKGWQLREKDGPGLVTRELATNIALLQASGGRPAEARRWIERARRSPARPGAATSSATVREHAVRLLTALDAADLDAFDHAWDELGDSYLCDELWPVVVSGFAGRRLAGGDVDGVLHALAEARGVHPATSAAGGLPTTVMGLLGAEAFLAAGRATEAHAAVEALPCTPAVQAVRALLAAVAGDLQEARHLLASTDISGATHRERLRLALVSVLTHHRQGHDIAAAAILEDVARFAQRGRLPMILATVPREDLWGLADQAPTARALLQELDDRGVHPLVPAHVELVAVSERGRDPLGRRPEPPVGGEDDRSGVTCAPDRPSSRRQR